MTILLAMDRATSVRSFDADGRLHVARANISKANVCPYFGREIPNWESLGLDADRVYNLLRDPEELAAAASTFNNLPVLSEHVPVTAFGEDSHREDLVVGSTGTDAIFDGTYITNSLVVWARGSIDGIERDEKRELSSAYRYRADMTAGNYNGVAYDGIMRDIVGNHVALVIEGRAGPDVYVGDEQPMAFKSKRALMVAGSLGGLIRPHLAQDAKIDLNSAIKGVTDATLKAEGAVKTLAEKVFGLVQPHLAADAAISKADIAVALDAVKDVDLGEDEDDEDLAEDEDVAEDEDLAEDEDVAEDEKDDKPAMDEKTVRKIADAARAKAEASFKAIRTAEREVASTVGDLNVVCDSAEDVYKIALDSLGVDLVGLPKSAYRATFLAVKQVKTDAAPVIAQDSKATKDARSKFDERYPNRAKIYKGY